MNRNQEDGNETLSKLQQTVAGREMDFNAARMRIEALQVEIKLKTEGKPHNYNTK